MVISWARHTGCGDGQLVGRNEGKNVSESLWV